MTATVTRPFTLEPYFQHLDDGVVELAAELEEEGNGGEDVAETVLTKVLEKLAEHYGEPAVCQALRRLLPRYA
jgi:hypothetical protein